MIYSVSMNKEIKMFSVISSTKLGDWWNLMCRFLNKFPAKLCKRFPLHLKNVSTLPCKNWNAHRTRATTELSEKKLQKLSHLNWGPPPNSPDLKAVDYGTWVLLQEKVYNIRIIDLDELKQWLRTEWAKLGHVVTVASLIAQDRWCLFYTPSLAIFPTRCY